MELVRVLHRGFTASNVLVTNNILRGISADGDPMIQNWLVRNNTFYSFNGITLVNSVFENNLLTNGGTPNFTNVTHSYNVSTGNSFTGGVGNQNTYAVADELVGTGTGISDDERFQLKTDAPLKTASSAGVEVGAFGGTTPYKISGISITPSIINMTHTATGSNTVPLSVTISVKGNN